MPQLKKNNAAYIPAISYHIAKASYFIHSEAIHSVASCPTAIFREAVLALAPHWSFSEIYASMVACPDDLVVRWFLLCGLCEAKRPMKLYGSREEAVKKRSAIAGSL